MMKIYNLIYALAVTILLSGCNFLDITPVGQVIPKKTSEYRALLNSAYHAVPQHKVLLSMRGAQFHPEPDPLAEILGTDYSDFERFRAIYTWDDTNADQSKTEEYPYSSFYKVIFLANEVVKNAPDAQDDGSEASKQVIGEAHALRAYCYFELANMYAPVYDKGSASTVKAVPVTTEIDIEQTFPRASLQVVYDLILQDVAKAEQIMSVEQQQTSENRYRFSRESLHALQSRIFLYMQEWQKAADAVKKALAINNGLEDMNSAEYKPNTNYQSREAMLSLEYPTNLHLRDYTSVYPQFLAAYKEGDLRPSKYFRKSDAGYMTLNKVNKNNERVSFRRAELYLNAAEASAHLAKDAEARQYMGDLLKNRYTPDAYAKEMQIINSLSGSALVTEILSEREKELALEGHQWYDWRRTGQPEVKKTVRGTEYILRKNDARYTLQIPKSAREANPLLNE